MVVVVRISRSLSCVCVFPNFKKMDMCIINIIINIHLARFIDFFCLFEIKNNKRLCDNIIYDTTRIKHVHQLCFNFLYSIRTTSFDDGGQFILFNYLFVFFCCWSFPLIYFWMDISMTLTSFQMHTI